MGVYTFAIVAVALVQICISAADEPAGAVSGNATILTAPPPIQTALTPVMKNFFMVEGDVFLTRGTPEERSNLLQKLVPLWTQVLAKHNVTNITVFFTGVIEMMDVGSTNVDTRYMVQGESAAPIDIQRYDSLWNNQIKKLVDKLDDKDISNELITIPGNPFFEPPPPNATVTVMVTPSSFSFSSDVFLTYTTDEQRESLLQKLQPLWSQVLAKFNISKVTVQFFRTIPLSENEGDTHLVQYFIIGESLGPVDTDKNLKSWRSQVKDLISKLGVKEISNDFDFLNATPGSAPTTVTTTPPPPPTGTTAAPIRVRRFAH